MSDENAPIDRPRIPLWLWPNVFGFDAVAVAVCWQYFFAQAIRVRIPPIEYAILGLIVWVIYSADRVMDAVRLAKPQTAALRHQFYHRHLKTMIALTVIGAVLAAFFVLTALPKPAVLAGAALSMLVALSFFHRLFVPDAAVLAVVPKELLAGFVFALGATLLGYAWSSEIPAGPFSKEVLWFGVLCSVNCLAISVWERESDEGNDSNAIAQLWPGSVAVFPSIAGATAVVCVVVAVLDRNAPSFPLLLASATGLALIALLAVVARKLRPAALRVLADVAVLLPALVYLPMVPWASIR